MTPGTLLAAMVRVQLGRPATFAELMAALLPRHGGVAVMAAGFAAAAQSRLLVGAERVFAYPQIGCANDEVSTRLSDRDRDVLAVAHGSWPGAAPSVMQRLRRIDTLHANGAGVGVIGLMQVERCAAILAGAAGVIAANRPSVVVAGGEAAVAACGPYLPDYHWCDSALVPCATAAERAERVAECGETLFCALPRERAPAILADEPEEAVLHRLIRALAANGWRGPIDPAARAPEQLAAAFDTTLVCGGLHPPEWDAPAGGRWTGAGLCSWFLLARPAPGRWRLVLEVADWGNDAGVLALRVDGVAVTRNAAIFGPFSVLAGPDELRVDLYPPPPVRDVLRGPRKIGVRIAGARLERA